MKKKLLSVLLITALGASLLAGCSSEKDSVSDKTEKKVEEKLTKVTLNEVAHSIFYAPMYVAIEEDYFKDEGIDLELVTGLEGVHLQPPKLIITGRLSLMNLDYMRLSLEVGLNQQGGSNTG